jgi:hypothetical protein
MENCKNISRQEFMDFFRDDDKLNELSNDDRIEIFCEILSGRSDFTKKLLDYVLNDYGVGHLEIIELNKSK